MKYRLAIFDFDGTLADTFGWFSVAFNQLAVEFGFPTCSPEELEGLRSQPAAAIIRQLGVPLWQMPRIAARARAMMAEELHRLSLFPGIPDALETLAEQGLELAIVSSNAESNIRSVLGGSASRIAWFECGVSMFGKSAKLKKALRQSGVKPADAIYIGDELRDHEAAASVSIDFGAVSWGYTLADVLRAGSPQLMFDSVDDLVAKLRPAG